MPGERPRFEPRCCAYCTKVYLDAEMPEPDRSRDARRRVSANHHPDSTEVNMRKSFISTPRRAWPLALAGLLAAVAAIPGAAFAAEEIFLNIPGIKGESTDAEHKNEIVLLSYSQSFSSSVGGQLTTNCGPVKVTKVVDRSSPSLIGAVLTAKAFPSIVITFRKSGSEPFEYYKLTLNNAFIESITQTDSSVTDSTTILETVSLSGTVFRFEYTRASSSPPIVFAWDCARNKIP